MSKKLSQSDKEMYLNALERELSFGNNQTGFKYEPLAFLFPSKYPHPDTFEYNIIDQEALEKFLSDFGYTLQKEIEGDFPNKIVIFLKK